MAIRLFYPPVEYRPEIRLSNGISLRDLCGQAGVPCRASGSWTERQIEIRYGVTVRILAEPSSTGSVRIFIPEREPVERARSALAALAYGLHDLVARASISGAEWNVVCAPRGRPRTGRALTNSERQRQFRNRHGR